VQQAQPDLKVFKAKLDLLALQDQLEPQVLQVQLVQRVHKVFKAKPDPRGQLEQLDQAARQEQLDLADQQAQRVQLVHKVETILLLIISTEALHIFVEMLFIIRGYPMQVVGLILSTQVRQLQPSNKERKKPT
jgi:hypothetical protein